MLEQRVLADFITQGHLESHIRKMRVHYARNRQALMRTLQLHFGDRVTILGEKAGIHVMVCFSTGLNEAEILQKAEAVGVGLMSARLHYLKDEKKNAFILGYGELDEASISEGISRLAQIL